MELFTWEALNHVEAKKNSDYSVAAYCASSSLIRPVYIEAAEQLGALFASEGIICINGAGNQGLMGAINESMLRHGGKVKGIIPRFMVEAGWCHDGLTELIVTDTIHERKALMAKSADAVVALPGGMGTLEELAEIITWKQLDLVRFPIILLNTDHYYDLFALLFHKMISEQFMRNEHHNLWSVVDTIGRSNRQIESFVCFRFPI